MVPWILIGLALCQVAQPAAVEMPLAVASRKQLFIDNRFVAKSEGVTLRANPGQKLGRMLDPSGKPFHGHVSRVIEDKGKIRLYLGHDGVAIHESDDGLHFRATGRSIGGGSFSTIFLDHHDPDPSRRYKLFLLKSKPVFDRKTDGVYAFTSPDGLEFREVGRVLPWFTDNPTIVLWDGRIGKYVVYLRALAYDSPNQRRIGRIELDDPLKPWPCHESRDPRPFLSTANVPVVLAADDEDDPDSDIYYNAATLYEGAQDVYLMFTTRFRHFSPRRNPFVIPPKPGQWEDFGPLEIQLAVSRDGISWHRRDREPYFPMGFADEWDRWYAVMGPGLVRRGNYLYQYYNSSGRLHDGAILRAEYDKKNLDLGGVGIIRQRVDGFVSADAGHQGGWLQTPLLTFQGASLRLNIDTGAMGTAFVELRDSQDRPIPGYTLADCEEIGGNFIDQRVYWKGKTSLAHLVGKPVRVRFQLKRARLYAFQFVGE